MVSEAQYRAEAREWDRAELLKTWARVQAGADPGDWPPGRALEYVVMRGFELEGAEVTYPYVAHGQLEQIDGVVYADGLTCLVETKDHNKPSDFVAVAKLRTQLMRRPGQCLGIVVSTSGFTDAATTLAQYLAPQMVLLWGADEMHVALHETRMRECLQGKFRSAVEHGLAYDVILTMNTLTGGGD